MKNRCIGHKCQSQLQVNTNPCASLHPDIRMWEESIRSWNSLAANWHALESTLNGVPSCTDGLISAALLQHKCSLTLHERQKLTVKQLLAVHIRDERHNWAENFRGQGYKCVMVQELFDEKCCPQHKQRTDRTWFEKYNANLC